MTGRKVLEAKPVALSSPWCSGTQASRPGGGAGPAHAAEPRGESAPRNPERRSHASSCRVSGRGEPGERGCGWGRRRRKGAGGGPGSRAGTDGRVSEQGTGSGEVDQPRGPSSGGHMRRGQQHPHPEAAVLLWGSPYMFFL